MQHEVFKLEDFYPEALKDTQYQATLTAYCPDNSSDMDEFRKRPTVLICPGGGYWLTADREAEPVALRLLPLGYNAFVLRYSTAPEKYPQALLQLAAAMAFIRARQEQFHVDVNKIAVYGFSAGGHLACSLGAFWAEKELGEAIGVDSEMLRPNALVLSYPVITSGEYAHRDSFINLVGADASAELLEKMSLEKQVNYKFPPVFLWHTFEDELVPVENSLLLAGALRAKGIPLELHIFTEGCHGLSLCDFESSNATHPANPHCANWFALCHEWLKSQFE